MWKRSSIVKWFFLTMENPETFPPGGRPQHQNHPIPSNWYDTLDRNANISLNSKGLRNAPGENNCFLNSAVQVRIYFYHLLSFHHIIMYCTEVKGMEKEQNRGWRPQKVTGEGWTESGIISIRPRMTKVLSSKCMWISKCIYVW